MQNKKINFLRIASVIMTVITLLSTTVFFSACASVDNYKIASSETDYVMIKVKGMGSMVIKLEPEIAPITVANFKKLVSQNFYDGLTFHRVIAGYMVQGGDPKGTGYGGSDETIVGEFKLNGYNNSISHERGVISMARGAYSYDSASSQFFIMHKTQKKIDGQYAAFGRVVAGIEVVDRIASVKVNSNDKPRTDVVIEYIKFAEPK